MLIPRYWAEARLRHRSRGKQLTLQRWGWSSASQDQAQEMANRRVKEAMEAALANGGIPLRPKREPKVAYGGADGVPVREEILEERPSGVLTRNSYGAECLNVPDVMFVDIDNEILLRASARSVRATLLLATVMALIVAATWADGVLQGLGWWLVGSLGGWAGLFALWGLIHRAHVAHQGYAVGMVRTALKKQVNGDPQGGCWRVYRTPRGARVLAMHALFDPKSPATQALMRQLHADPVYATMCVVQGSFRARVSPKPWRIPGLERMRGPVWPVQGPALLRRSAWVAQYNARKDGFASCQFVEQLGQAAAQPAARDVQQWHDEQCQALSGKPLA